MSAGTSIQADEGTGTPTALRARILDTLGDAVIATNRYGRIIYWNGAAERLYGWTAEDVLGSDLLDVTSADQLRSRAAVLMAILRGRDWSGEILVRDRRGRVFPVAATGSALRDHRGEPTGIVTVSRDVSRHRQAKEALQESEERLELVRRAVSSVVWELDLGTGRVDWSETFADAFGYRPEEVGGTTEWWLERVHPDDRGRVEAGFRDFLADRRRFWTDDYRFRRGDGTFAEVFDRAYASPAAGGERRRIAGSMVDLTERRRRMDEQRLLSQASMILDLSLNYHATLPTLARLIVNDLAEMCVVRIHAGAGLPDTVAAAHRHPGAQPALDELARITDGEIPAVQPLSLLADGESLLIPSVPTAALRTSTLPERVRTLIGELGPDSALLLPVRARGETVGTLALARTDAMRPFDDDSRSTAEELGRRIGRAVDHARLFESAQLAHQAKSDFLAVISHELRTPLTAVLGYADLLEQEITGPLNHRQKEQVGRIRASSDRLHRLIESILAYVRLESADERPQPRTIDLDELLDRVEEIVAPRARQERVDFRIERDRGPDRLTTDPDRLLQVLLPLLTNALKFSRPGDRVRLRVVGDADGVRFDVMDNGPGIPEEHQPYIFNVFWQAEQPSTRRAGGAGLGLSVARRVARLLGGDVVLVSSSPDGSTFRLRLPADPTR